LIRQQNWSEKENALPVLFIYGIVVRRKRSRGQQGSTRSIAGQDLENFASFYIWNLLRISRGSHTFLLWSITVEREWNQSIWRAFRK
jgi:hypothetical protein